MTNEEAQTLSWPIISHSVTDFHIYRTDPWFAAVQPKNRRVMFYGVKTSTSWHSCLTSKEACWWLIIMDIQPWKMCWHSMDAWTLSHNEEDQHWQQIRTDLTRDHPVKPQQEDDADSCTIAGWWTGLKRKRSTSHHNPLFNVTNICMSNTHSQPVTDTK